MKLSFQNIGRVAKADIEIDAITVITGANDTGKSTVGKLLYGIYTALNQLTPEYLLQSKYESVLGDFDLLRRRVLRIENNEDELKEFLILSRERLLELWDVSENTTIENEDKLDSLIKYIVKNVKSFFEENSDDKPTGIEGILEDMLDKSNVKSSNEDSQRLLIENVLLEEFSGSLTTELKSKPDADIHFIDNKENFLELTLRHNKIIKEISHISIKRDFSQVFYIDNPFILNDLDRRKISIFIEKKRNNPADSLLKLLSVKEEKNFYEEAILEKDISNIFSSVIKGNIKSSHSGYKYYEKGLSEPISIKNISTGMKSFALLQLLMDYGHLNKRSEMLILDEPEIHLHPDWQLKYAELIVLIAKEFQLQVLITSHSTDFVEAIDLYSQMHKINDGVRFYKTQSATSEMTEIVNVTDNLESLYKDMVVSPIETFEKLEEELDGR